METQKTILLIDDDQDMHDVVKMVLEPEGFQVRCAATGSSGLQALREIRPDLVLLDIMLETPSTGFHLAYELRRDEALKDIPIIMLSAVGRKMGMDYARELGSDYVPAEKFLDKPFDAKALRNAVHEVLDRVRS